MPIARGYYEYVATKSMPSVEHGVRWRMNWAVDDVDSIPSATVPINSRPPVARGIKPGPGRPFGI
jgi:hypothetical protein